MKIFIAGPRAITTLGELVEARLYGIYEKNFAVLVGDANGVDKAIQKYFYGLNYDNVIVYSSNGKVRNNIGNWQVESVPVDGKVSGFDFYAIKDKAMADDADFGFMIWNGESKGTLNNMVNLLKNDKKVLVYFTPLNVFISIDSLEKLESLVNDCTDNAKKIFTKIYTPLCTTQEQLVLS